LNAAPVEINDGKLPRVQHVASHDDIRSPEEREDVAVGVRRRRRMTSIASPFNTSLRE
jgi:hypothetical protein